MDAGFPPGGSCHQSAGSVTLAIGSINKKVWSVNGRWQAATGPYKLTKQFRDNARCLPRRIVSD